MDAAFELARIKLRASARLSKGGRDPIGATTAGYCASSKIENPAVNRTDIAGDEDGIADRETAKAKFPQRSRKEAAKPDLLASTANVAARSRGSDSPMNLPAACRRSRKK